MNGMELVAEIKRLRVKEERLRTRIDSLRNERDKITNDITKERVQSSRVGDKVQQLAVRIADASTELEEVLSDKIQRAQELGVLIDRLPDEELGIVIEANIIGGASIPEVAKLLNYSEATAYRRRYKALEYLKKIDKV